MDHPTVLIISDEVDFSRRMTARWQMERNVPTFTLLSGDLWPRFAVDAFDVAIVGRVAAGAAFRGAGAAALHRQPIFCVCRGCGHGAAGARALAAHFRAAPRRRTGSKPWCWPASEAVHRARAEARARAAETACATLDRQATLGRYMLEMRHNLNNALTSVLGNSDLLLLEPGSLSAQTRAQIETIRNMTLRIHEVCSVFRRWKRK